MAASQRSVGLTSMKFRNFLLLITLSLTPAYIQAQAAPDALVVTVKGQAFFKESKDGKPKLLKKGDKLFAGQQVRCYNGCQQLSISYCNITRPVNKSDKWTTILSINCAAVKVPRGGAPKGPVTLIISPREAEVIRPDGFSLKWKPTKEPVATTIVLTDYLGNEIWSKKYVPGDSGSLTSDGLNRVLKDAQEKGYLDFTIMLDQPENGSREKVTFKLLAPDQDLKLAKELATTKDETDEVFKRLSRALRFMEYQLHSEAVQELEPALIVLRNAGADADSVDQLTRLLISANYKAYNAERVEQLCATLKKQDLMRECSQQTH
jgi:hypothetical protein